MSEKKEHPVLELTNISSQPLWVMGEKSRVFLLPGERTEFVVATDNGIISCGPADRGDIPEK